MANKNISVVVTSHNYGKYIKKCIDSLCNQTLTPREIIIIDDASDDNTKDRVKIYLEKYQNIKIIYKKVAFSNAQESRRFGLSLTTSDLILLVDADNYLASTMLEKMVDKLYKDNADLVYSDQYLINEAGDIQGSWIAHGYSYTRLQRLSFIDICSLCKKEFLAESFFDKNIKRFQDWDVWLQYLKGDNKNVAYLHDKLIYKRVHTKSISHTREKYLERLKVMYKNNIIKLSFPEDKINFKNDKIFFQCLCPRCVADSIDKYFYNLRKKFSILRGYDLFIFTFSKHCVDERVNITNPTIDELITSTMWGQVPGIIFSKKEMHDFLNATTTLRDVYKKFLNK